jgi:hypothetical protein
MNIRRISIAVTVMSAVLGAAYLAQASQDYPQPAPFKPNLSGLHDFDLRAGEWVAHHRRLKERLAGSHEWVEFDGTQSFRLLMDGYANEDENILNMPGGGAYKGVTLRAYDAKSGQCASSGRTSPRTPRTGSRLFPLTAARLGRSTGPRISSARGRSLSGHPVSRCRVQLRVCPSSKASP